MLGALIVLRRILVLLKRGVMLVQTIIGQMSILVMLIPGNILSILNSCKPNQSLLIDINSQRIDAHQSDVYPEIKLVAIQEHRLVEVLAHDATLLQVGDVQVVVRYEDALALGARARLHYVVLAWVGLHGLLELGHLVR